MNITSRQTVCLGAFLAIIASCWFVLSMTLKAQTEKPRAKTIQLDTDGKHSLQILGGPPETVTMKSDWLFLFRASRRVSTARDNTKSCWSSSKAAVK